MGNQDKQIYNEDKKGKELLESFYNELFKEVEKVELIYMN